MNHDDAISGNAPDLSISLDADHFLDLNFGRLSSTLDAPEIIGVVDPDDPDGTMPVGSHERDLEVRIPLWPSTAPQGFSDQLLLYFKSGPGEIEVQCRVFPGPIDPDDFPLPMLIPKHLLPTDARCEVRYLVNSFNGFIVGSEVSYVTFDTLPPSYDRQLDALLLPDDLVDGKITEEYLTGHADRVELRLPLDDKGELYLGAKPGDVISLYWSEYNPPNGAPVATHVVTDDEIASKDIRLDLTGDVIRDSGKDGLFYLTYKIRDRAGNETPIFSRETEVNVALETLPELPELPEPEFPDADTWGYINCGHKPWEGIRVRLPFPQNRVDLNDEVILSWQGYETFNGVTPIEGTQGEFSHTVTAGDLAAGYKDIVVQPYTPHIEPIEEGSAIACYRLIKSNGQKALSYDGLIKITRKLPSGELCGPDRPVTAPQYSAENE